MPRGRWAGLIQVGRRIHEHVRNALEMGELCSNDPVCSQHDPQSTHEHRFLHGAACHGCLLIAETSCEQHNDFLDRALVVPTVDNLGIQFLSMANSMNTLTRLSTSDLKALATLLRSGRLAPPYSATAFRQIMPREFVEDIASELQECESREMKARAVAAAIDLLVEDRSRRPMSEEVLDLVTSGPDAEGIAESRYERCRSRAIRQRPEVGLVAGYAVYQGRRVFLALADRMQGCRRPEGGVVSRCAAIHG